MSLSILLTELTIDRYGTGRIVRIELPVSLTTMSVKDSQNMILWTLNQGAYGDSNHFR